MKSTKINLLIGDAQHLFRFGLKQLLQKKEDIEIIAEADNRKDLFAALIQHKPHVIVFDYDLPGYFTHEDVKDICYYAPSSKVLIISSDHNKMNIYQVLEYGVHGFLTKECNKEEIIRAIYATAKGEKFFCNKVLNVLLEKRITQPQSDCEPTCLSEREIEISRYIANGHTNTAIAEKLIISVHTVRSHRKNIMRKLKINSVSELVLYAVSKGLVKS